MADRIFIKMFQTFLWRTITEGVDNISTLSDEDKIF